MEAAVASKRGELRYGVRENNLGVQISSVMSGNDNNRWSFHKGEIQFADKESNRLQMNWLC